MAFVVKDCKQVKSTTMADNLAAGSVTVLDIAANYEANDSTKSIIKGTVTVVSGEAVILELVDDAAPTVAIATLKTDTSGTYGFAFTPSGTAKYSLNVYKVLS
ncbi:MAG: hypothetical protein ACRCYC_15735 [Paraclostridium sp.]|uniref:hypothetical protein n=1 Tax=Paraclostridium sp. TaxID=2023273 RepID=UPI003F2E52FF